MKYQGVCISVSDIAPARKFYEDLFGLEVFQDYGLNVSFSGGLSLQQGFGRLLDIPEEKILNKPHNMELYFEEDDFDGFAVKLARRGDIRYLGGGVREAPWGQRLVRFYDLDGHIIEVGENMKTVVRRFLGSGLSMEETSKRMDVSAAELEKLLASG